MDYIHDVAASKTPLTPLPKKASAPAFKKLHQALTTTIEARHWVLILDGALDRKTLEGILRKHDADAVRTAHMERAEVVGRMVGALIHLRDAAFAVFRALDRSCLKERSIVGSIATDDLDDHVTQYKALDFRRERARMLWALLRDGRDKAHSLVEAILADAFHRDDVHRQLTTPSDTGDNANASDERVQLAREELLKAEAILTEQQKTLQQEQQGRLEVEKERSKLIVRLGQREKALKAAESARDDLERQLKELRRDHDNAQQQLQGVDDDVVRSLRDERDALRTKANALERQVERMQADVDEVERVKAQAAALQGEVAKLQATLDASKKSQTSLLGQITARERAAQERVTSLRSALKAARQLTAQQPSDVAASAEVKERVGIFVDVANIGASAKRVHGKNFDFIAMKDVLLDDRKQTLAVAFVVEAETQKGMSGFSKELRGAGYDVRIKRPKVRSDGSRKADWDIGIAMEVVEARNVVDTVILVTGDGDFLPLIAKVKKWGKRVELASFLDRTDRGLLKAVDHYEDLTGQYLLER